MTAAAPHGRPSRATTALATAALLTSLASAACTGPSALEDDGQHGPAPLGVSFEITGRNAHHPDGPGPLHAGDPDILRQRYVDDGWEPLAWSTRYRFPVDVTDTDGRTWEVQGLTEDAGALFDPAFSADGPVAVTADLDGPVTLLVPDLTDDDGTTPRTLVVERLGSEVEQTLRDRPAHPRLYVDASTFGSLVEQAGGVAWAEGSRAEPGGGGPAAPVIVGVWLMYAYGTLSASDAYDRNTAVEAAGFEIPSHL